jgi:hypothetical protein
MQGLTNNPPWFSGSLNVQGDDVKAIRQTFLTSTAAERDGALLSASSAPSVSSMATASRVTAGQVLPVHASSVCPSALMWHPFRMSDYPKRKRKPVETLEMCICPFVDSDVSRNKGSN